MDSRDLAEAAIKGSDPTDVMVEHDGGMDRIARGEMFALGHQIAGAVGVSQRHVEHDRADLNEEVIDLASKVPAP